MITGVIGAGAMGSGIAQLMATFGFEVRLYDVNPDTTVKALQSINVNVGKLAAKGKIPMEDITAIIGRIYICETLHSLADCDLVIEAVVEDIQIKQQLFKTIESTVSEKCIIATNTSSLSVTNLASTLELPERCIGIHFFNPVMLMPLVEIIPAVQTDEIYVRQAVGLIEKIGKKVVMAKDTPGFIVNKVARPYYSEAIRILEEGISNVEEIDAVMFQNGFKMGPFMLMDFIGHDVNYRVTESIWKSFFYDSRYRPSFTQLRLLEAGHLGKKSGRGFYVYPITEKPVVEVKPEITHAIFLRIISMLINEAADTVYLNICSPHDVDEAVRLGLNYPKGLIEWGKEIGYQKIVSELDRLFGIYHEERYRVSPLLRKMSPG